MATLQEIKKVTESFAHNFEQDGFLVFDNKCKTAFEGRILIDYKGLRVIKFRKSQEQEEAIPSELLREATHAGLAEAKANPNDVATIVLRTLKSQFERCSVGVLAGKDFHFDSTGTISTYSEQGIAVFLF